MEQERKELESRNRELQQQALHDPLTKVYNRQFFDETLDREASRCQRSAAALGVLFIDIDHFKSVNDTFGHQFGDQVLKQVSQVVQSAIRASDVLARYGGEEFVVLASHATERGLEKLAERIRERVEHEPFQSGDHLVKVTCSVGAAIVIPERNARDIGKQLVAAADACLYEAKHAGRNQVKSTSLVQEADRQLMQLMTIHRFSRWLVSQQLLDVPTVSKALIESTTPPKKVGELGVEQGYLTADQVAEVLQDQQASGERFGAIALRLGHLTQNQLVHLLTLQQENPKQLAGLLIQRGLMTPDKVLAALEQYLRTEAPPRPAQTPVECA
jgi:diguanylate cyclase (GGDEF)-like protein